MCLMFIGTILSVNGCWKVPLPGWALVVVAIFFFATAMLMVHAGIVCDEAKKGGGIFVPFIIINLVLSGFTLGVIESIRELLRFYEWSRSGLMTLWALTVIFFVCFLVAAVGYQPIKAKSILIREGAFCFYCDFIKNIFHFIKKVV